ncbi:unnamed protein product [Prorocentrum cordatum]|uniref:Uncharacterized protein n=1 Tax=Prorocentrum cordatum TaxID=2364126 RepID=A0ABN9SSJ8_9DINO|nr:unnamed protein product [Polarella glacialis]
MDLAFWLVESQARAHDSDLKVQDLLDYKKLVSDAKADHVDITFQKLDMDNATVVAAGDSSHGNVGKTKTAGQAGLVILLADNTDDQFIRGQPAKVTPTLWRSHRIKRVVRSTLAVETMAALESKRLLSDIESLRKDIEFNSVVSKWVNTKQMLADCLTKQDVRAGVDIGLPTSPSCGKETDTTNDIEHHEDANVISDENQVTDDTADLDDVNEIYMMDAASAETEEIGGGAAGAGATLVVCAVCRMVVDQCECQPRTRKKVNHNIPVPNDDDEWVEIPGQTEQSGGSTTRKKTTELPMDKVRRLHERLRHASYKQVEHDLSDVLENYILEAYQQVVAGCNKCRRASYGAEDIPKGKGSEKGKGKLRTSCRVDPDECVHPADQLSTVGTNQYKDKVRCHLCDTLLVDRGTKWWSEEKELRAEVEAIRLEK